MSRLVRDGGVGAARPSLSATLIPAPLTAALFVVLHQLGLFNAKPLPVLLGVLAAGAALGICAAVAWPAGCSRRQLHLRTVIQSMAAAAVIYSTGWGPALGVGFAIAAAENIRNSGARAAPPAILYCALAILAGQFAVEVGVAPSEIPTPEAHGLAALIGLGCAMAIGFVGAAAAREERAREDVRRNERRFRALVENSPDVVVVLDRHGRPVYVSPGFEAVFPSTPVEGIAEAMWNEVHPDDLDRAHALARHALARPGELLTAEIRGRGPTGRWRWLELRVTNRFDDPAVDGIVANIADITERRELDQLRAEFIANAAHELRTPLTSFVGSARALAAADPDLNDPARREYRDLVARQGDRIETLIANLLDLAQIEHGALHLDFAPVALHEVVAVAGDMVRPARSAELDVSVAPDLVAFADRLRLEQIVTNLLCNAYRYGGPNVSVEGNAASDQVSLVVADDGPGIDPELVPHLFEPFRRGCGQSDVPGSGLGLALCRRLAEAMGGEIRYEPGSRAGARFIVRMPAYVTRQAATSPL